MKPEDLKQVDCSKLGEVPGYYLASATATRSAPKHEMPVESMPARAAKAIVEDEFQLDGRPTLNLASFVTTSMEPEAEEIMREAAKKNFIDLDEYPRVAAMHQRCVNMLCRLYNAPLKPEQDGCGTGTVGSSEAIMLATLAMKWAWKSRCSAKGVPATNPNIVFGSNVQVCWHKACKYFEIESREANVSPDCLVLTAERAKPLIDENTIGVCPILGSTFNGEYEDVKAIHDMVVELNKEKGWDVPIHVDAASGGFIAPFVTPQLVWDFRLPNVKSINVSGHKFGLTYAGIGWLCFRELKDLHPDLVFHVTYLGGDQASFTLNFSKGSGTTVAQYYQLIRLGKDGYTHVMMNCMQNAQYLREELVQLGNMAIVDKQHIPCVAWSLKDDSKYTVFDIQDKLSNKGWIVPAYRCSAGAETLAIMRVVVRPDLTRDLMTMLLQDIKEACDWLEHHPTVHAEIKDEIHAKATAKASKDRPVRPLHKMKHRRTKRRGSATGTHGSDSETESVTPPLIHKHQIHALGVDPTHRASGETTTAIC